MLFYMAIFKYFVNCVYIDSTIICLQSVPSDSGANEVVVQDLTASWSMDENKLSLSNISFTVNKVLQYNNVLLIIFNNIRRNHC